MTDASPRLTACLGHITGRLGVPAAAVAIIAHGRAPITALAVQRRRDRPDPVKAGDRWHIGSFCKAATTLLHGRQ